MEGINGSDLFTAMAGFVRAIVDRNRLGTLSRVRSSPGENGEGRAMLCRRARLVPNQAPRAASRLTRPSPFSRAKRLDCPIIVRRTSDSGR